MQFLNTSCTLLCLIAKWWISTIIVIPVRVKWIFYAFLSFIPRWQLVQNAELAIYYPIVTSNEKPQNRITRNRKILFLCINQRVRFFSLPSRDSPSLLHFSIIIYSLHAIFSSTAFVRTTQYAIIHIRDWANGDILRSFVKRVDIIYIWSWWKSMVGQKKKRRKEKKKKEMCWILSEPDLSTAAGHATRRLSSSSSSHFIYGT